MNVSIILQVRLLLCNMSDCRELAWHISAGIEPESWLVSAEKLTRCCNGSTGRGPLNMFSARDMDRTLALFRIQSGIWPESPSTKNVAIASKSASSSGIEPVKALKDRFMSVSFLQLLSSFGMLPLSPAPLQTAELDCPAHRCWQFSIEVVLWYIKFLQTFETTNWPRDGACELASGELKNF